MSTLSKNQSSAIIVEDTMNDSMVKKNISMANKTRLKQLQVSIKKSPSNEKNIEKDKETIQKENEYVDQLIAGWSEYSDMKKEIKLYVTFNQYSLLLGKHSCIP
jgi:hypothetical protein